jgi:asparagine synthase (glutamine-hydrolysing)
MCGICGAAWTDIGHGPSQSQLDAMVQALHHRGPDDAGVHRDGNSALGFRRLSILDVAGAHQPMSNEDGSVWIVFNGEIYNYPALRHRLEAKGHTLRTSGDTEVISHLYEDEGPGFFRLLRGMFAIAVWDAGRKTLVLGRDRLGQKPLLYRVERDRILFASELKSLLTLPSTDVPRVVDPLAIDRYLTYGYVPHPGTILKGVHKLPPAHFAVWHEGRLSLERYWEPDWDREVDRSVDEDAEELRSTLDEAVHEQMVSEVPLGAFLSGGIDSTIIVGLMQRHSSQKVKTFSIGFDDPAFDETEFARMASNHLHTDHHEFRIEPKAWETIPKLAEQFDEPFADSSALPTWYVSRETRAHVTVALTGDAGDELFGGYDRYRGVALAAAMERLPVGVRSWMGGPMARAIPASSRAKTRLRTARRWLEAAPLAPEARYLRWMTSFDEGTRLSLYTDDFLESIAAASDGLTDAALADPSTILTRALNVASKRDPVTRAMIADLLTYLPGDLLSKVDLASMAHSLECRGPFLDHRVVELALTMPLKRKLRLRGGRSKVILKRAFADLLPEPIRNRKKMGFAVPLDRWFRGPLADELRSVLLDPATVARGLFRPDSVRAMIDEHQSGKRDHAYRLWALMMLELWYRRYGS